MANPETGAGELVMQAMIKIRTLLIEFMVTV